MVGTELLRSGDTLTRTLGPPGTDDRIAGPTTSRRKPHCSAKQRFEAQASWRPLPGPSLDGALFVDDSRLSKPAAAFAGEKDASLPNIADVIARVGMRYGFAIERRVELSGSLR